LIEHKRITTTVAKAKALRIYVEPLITKAKEDTTNSRRQVFSYLQNKHAVSELFREITAKIGDRPGGYTRILKTGTRFGDNAEMCMIELVDYNENMLSDAGDAKEKATTRRSRRGSKKKTEGDAVVAQASEPVVETTAEVVEVAEDIAEEVVEAVAEVKEELVEETVTEKKVEEPVAKNDKEEKKDEKPAKEKPKDKKE
jgi:large subunit ribosomal protein L17